MLSLQDGEQGKDACSHQFYSLSAGGFSLCDKAREKKKKDIQTEKEVKLFLFTGDVIIYAENATESIVGTRSISHLAR